MDGLLIPVMVVKAASSEFGPFTYDQVIWRDDWQECEVAAEIEIGNLISHGTFDLVDIFGPMNQGKIIVNESTKIINEPNLECRRVRLTRLHSRFDSSTFARFECKRVRSDSSKPVIRLLFIRPLRM